MCLYTNLAPYVFNKSMKEKNHMNVHTCVYKGITIKIIHLSCIVAIYNSSLLGIPYHVHIEIGIQRT